MRFDADTLSAIGEPFLVVADGSGPSVAADGTLTYVPRSGDASALAWVARDGTVSRLAEPLEGRIQQPVLSPDGSRVVAVVGPPGSPPAVVVFDLAKGARWRATAGDLPEGFPFWLHNGQSVGFSIQAPQQPPRVVHAAWNGSSAPTVIADDASMGDASADGTQLLFTRRSDASKWVVDVWRRELSSRKEVLVSGESGMPRLSPDGRLLAFIANSGGAFDLFVRQFPDGDGHWRVSSRSGAYPRWSRKGDRLYYIENSGRLMQVDISSGPPVVIGAPRPALPREPPDVQMTAGFDVSPDDARFSR